MNQIEIEIEEGIKGEQVITEFREAVTTLIAGALDYIIETQELSAVYRNQFINEMLTIEALTRQDSIDLKQISKSVHEISLAVQKLIDNQDNHALLVRLKLLDYECGAYLRKSSDFG